MSKAAWYIAGSLDVTINFVQSCYYADVSSDYGIRYQAQIESKLDGQQYSIGEAAGFVMFDAWEIDAHLISQGCTSNDLYYWLDWQQQYYTSAQPLF